MSLVNPESNLSTPLDMFAPERPEQRNDTNSLSQDELVRLREVFAESLWIDTAEITREGANLKGIIHASWTDENEQRKYRVLAYFERPGLPTPVFSIYPKSGMSFLIGAVAGVEFPNASEFNKKFSVISFFQKSTRALLNKGLMQALIDLEGVVVKTGSDGRVAIYQQEGLLGSFGYAGITQDFFRQVENLADRIFEAAASLAPGDKPNGKEVIEAYKPLLIGGKDSLVTSEDVKTLLMQPSPREIPKTILNKACRDSGMLGAMGAVFAAAGLLFVLMALPEKDIAIILFGSIFFLIGSPMAFFALRYSWSRKRILRDGECKSMQVLEVCSTNGSVNNAPLYSVTVQAGQYSARLTVVGSDAANLARKRQSHGQPIKALVDPINPSRMLWVEGWAVDAGMDSGGLG